MRAILKWLGRAAFVALVALSVPIIGSSDAQAQACGEDNQPACKVVTAKFCGFLMPDGEIPICWDTSYTCKNEYLSVDAKNFCHPWQRPAGLTCCTQVNYTDTGGYRITEGYYATVDLRDAWIVVPTRAQPGECQMNLMGYWNVLYSIPKWSEMDIYKSRLKINANFFDVSRINPYNYPCTNGLGLTISNKEQTSAPGPVHGVATQSLAFMTPDYTRAHNVYAVIDADVLGKYGAGNIQNAVSGYRLIQDGSYVEQPEPITPDLYRPRSALGLSRDGFFLYLVVVNPGNDDGGAGSGGTTLRGLAHYLRSLGAWNGLTLDGSGSAQLKYYDPDTGASYETKPSDELPGKPGKYYRPVPIFLGVL